MIKISIGIMILVLPGKAVFFVRVKDSCDFLDKLLTKTPILIYYFILEVRGRSSIG